MKNLFKTVILAGAIAAATSSAAFAGGNPDRMAQRSYEYWNQKNAESTRTSGTQQVSDTAAMPKASQYPCSHCIYDEKAGGYVKKYYGKN